MALEHRHYPSQNLFASRSVDHADRLSLDFYDQPFTPGCTYSVDRQNPSFAFNQYASNPKSNAFRPCVQAEYMQQQQADLQPPFSCFQTTIQTTNFVPVEAKEEIKEEQLTHTDHSDFSAATASSTERNGFQSFCTSGSEEKVRKKVGRPIAYKGDPNAANLTEAERRRIKRRIANRESARRVRARRQETLEELHTRMDQVSVRNGDMVKHIADVEGHTVLLKGQLEECEHQWNKSRAENARLHQKVSSLRASLQAKSQASSTSPQLAADNPVVLKIDDYTMTRANSFCTAPVTGISCALIEELPTMALPIPDIMTLPLDVEDCPDFML
ncbi:TPA: hypothetical protein ACH3X3_007241 [Trebouxia sp. C0006]